MPRKVKNPRHVEARRGRNYQLVARRRGGAKEERPSPFRAGGQHKSLLAVVSVLLILQAQELERLPSHSNSKALPATH